MHVFDVYLRKVTLHESQFCISIVLFIQDRWKAMQDEYHNLRCSNAMLLCSLVVCQISGLLIALRSLIFTVAWHL